MQSSDEGRRHKTSGERRSQRDRAAARVVSWLLYTFQQVSTHRGSKNTKLGRALEVALQAQTARTGQHTSEATADEVVRAPMRKKIRWAWVPRETPACAARFRDAAGHRDTEEGRQEQGEQAEAQEEQPNAQEQDEAQDQQAEAQEEHDEAQEKQDESHESEDEPPVALQEENVSDQERNEFMTLEIQKYSDTEVQILDEVANRMFPGLGSFAENIGFFLDWSADRLKEEISSNLAIARNCAEGESKEKLFFKRLAAAAAEAWKRKST